MSMPQHRKTFLEDRKKQKQKANRLERTKDVRQKYDKQIIEKMYVRTRTQELYNMLESGNFDPEEFPLLEQIQDINARNLAYRKEKASHMYYIVSVNLPSTVPFDTEQLDVLFTKVEKYVNRSMIYSYVYTYEYHTEQGSHPHCHILIYTAGKEPKGKVIKYTKSTFKCLEKAYVGFKVDNRNHLNILPVVHVRDMYDYICGIKTDEEKMVCVSEDNELKLSLGMELYHLSETPFVFPLPEGSCAEGREDLDAESIDYSE